MAWTQADILASIITERGKQGIMWGQQNHSVVEWIAILTEEVGEAARAANHAYWSVQEERNDPALPSYFHEYYAELVQVAAVAVAALESLHRNEIPGMRQHRSQP